MAVAISAIAAAAAAVGTEAFIGLAATAIADTGLALTVVGAVTGSKDLMKAGAVMGMVGGIGGIANSMFGAADAAAGSLADEGLATQGDSINALESHAASGLSDSGIVSGASDLTTQPIATETGQSLGGNAQLAGAGGNIDPSTGMPSLGSSGGAMPSPSAPTNIAAPATSSVSATPGMPDDSLNVQANSSNALDQGANYSGTRASSIIGSLKDLWGGLSNDQKTLVLRGALAIPGSMQAQQNKARELALQASRIKQTSYGSDVPSFSLPSSGVIGNARS